MKIQLQRIPFTRLMKSLSTIFFNIDKSFQGRRIMSHFTSFLHVTSFHLDQGFPTFFCSRSPMQKKENSRTPQRFVTRLLRPLHSVNFKLIKIWRTTRKFSRTPGRELLIQILQLLLLLRLLLLLLLFFFGKHGLGVYHQCTWK